MVRIPKCWIDRAKSKGNTRQPSELEEELAAQIRLAGLPAPLLEHLFAKGIGRLWRFDFAWPAEHGGLAVECNGGHWTNGRHNRGTGFQADCEKYSAAAVLGWRIIHCTGSQIKSGAALRWIEEALKS